jgi:ArsR family transcriptional regulator
MPLTSAFLRRIECSMAIKQSTDRRAIRRAASIFKALADENRLALLLMLNQDCRCSHGCEVGGEQAQRTLADAGRSLGISMPTVSHHLKQLRRAGLITCVRSGRRVHCTIDLDPLQGVLAAIGVKRAPMEVTK